MSTASTPRTVLGLSKQANKVGTSRGKNYPLPRLKMKTFNFEVRQLMSSLIRTCAYTERFACNYKYTCGELVRLTIVIHT